MPEMKPDTVVLFINDKGDNDRRPCLKGTALWNGQEIELALWSSTSKNGKEYYKGKLQKPFRKKAPEQQSGW